MVVFRGCSHFFVQQASLVLDDLRAKTKRITVYLGEPRQTLRRKLRGDDIDEELPLSWHFRKTENQVSSILGDVLSNQHDGCAQPLQIARHSQILAAHASCVDPHTET